MLCFATFRAQLEAEIALLRNRTFADELKIRHADFLNAKTWIEAIIPRSRYQQLQRQQQQHPQAKSKGSVKPAFIQTQTVHMASTLDAHEQDRDRLQMRHIQAGRGFRSKVRKRLASHSQGLYM